MTNTVLNTRAFIGEIRQVVSEGEGGGAESKYFVSISIPHGDKDNRKYQYLSCYVSKNLNRLFGSAYQSQVKEEDNRVVNTLSAQVVTVSIEAPFFEINDKGYLDGSGILKSVMFE
ncbi:TPA: hypothetical protein ACPHXL_003514 [Vibrio alginolyticus]|uniref:hypothetical protein n=1 Tax=Vibrio alginolyticus TaxID=663 RepID=UPI002277751E|nr:hypothetical protein [Vibrio alginolyticus]WAE59644.1 hypothetical protein OPR71_24345 [Vibrio alginolyticus]